jgi:RNA polymerase sigma-70 factor (ECF subfamily)
MTALAWLEQNGEHAPTTEGAGPRLRGVAEDPAERRRRIAAAIIAQGLPPLRRMALRWARESDADDLVQDTVERALRAVDRFEETSNLQAWLRKIMYHVAVDRARQRASRQTAGDVESLAVEEPPPPPAWSELSVEQIRAAAERLREPIRTAYRLHLEEHLTYAQLGARLGVPIGTVATRLHRARLQIRRLLEEELDLAAALRPARRRTARNESRGGGEISC